MLINRFFLIAATLLVIAVGLYVADVPRQFAAALLADSYVTPDYLTEKYRNGEQIRVLIVPGHDEQSPGAQYQGIREEDLTLEMGKALYERLSPHDVLHPVLLRTERGYIENFDAYYRQNTSAIERFIRRAHRQMQSLFASGEVKRRREVYHNVAPSDVVHRLYGINKWANDTEVDLVIHIHFNDHNRRREPYRRYSGFSIYIPEKQLPNHDGSHAVAQNLLGALSEHFPISDLSGESSGIVEDQDLIAIGANGSLMPAVAFMEYSYIYESHIKSEAVRPLAIQEFAHQTYRGLLRFFDKDAAARLPHTAVFPYTWKRQLEPGMKYSPDVFALQLALSAGGWYPPRDLSSRRCPITGNYGDCTTAAVRAFQYATGLPPVGRVGPQTRAQLNERHADAYSFAE